MKIQKQNHQEQLQREAGESPDTFQVALPGGDVQRGVAVRVDRAEGAAGVEHQFGDVHAARVRRPVETHVELLRGDRRTPVHVLVELGTSK